jgi:ABC-type nitrate/sulfonate/bicarbonate transport system substrate-binding protein
MRWMRSAISACAFMAVGAMVWFGNEAGAAPAPKVSVGQVSATATSWPMIIAQRQGFFAANGIEIETIQIGVSEGMQALTSGSLSLMHDPCNTVIAFIERGVKNVRIGIVTVATHPGILIGKKGVGGIGELRGKTIGVSSVNSGSTVLVRRLLKAHGLENGQYDVVGGQGTAELFKGLQAGVFDAVWLIPPQSVAATDAGFPALGTFREVAPKFEFACFAANLDWLKSDPKDARAFGKSWLAGVSWLYDPANRAEAESYLADAMKLAPAVARETYEEMVVKNTDYYPRDGKTDPEALRAVVDISFQGGELQTMPTSDVSSYVDETMLGGGAVH